MKFKKHVLKAGYPRGAPGEVLDRIEPSPSAVFGTKLMVRVLARRCSPVPSIQMYVQSDLSEGWGRSRYWNRVGLPAKSVKRASSAAKSPSKGGVVIIIDWLR